MSSRKNFDLSSQFLSLLDPSASSFTFQTFGEGEEKYNPELIHVLHGSLPDLSNKLVGLNQQAAGIFVTVNETDGTARSAENIIRVRAIWQDDDEGYDGVFPLEPSIIVSTSPSRFQRLWLADGLSKEDFHSLMRTMVVEYGSDGNAKDISRVLRLPSFYHVKSKPYPVTIVEASGKRYTRDELLQAFPAPKAFSSPEKTQNPRPSYSSKNCGHVSSEDSFQIRGALRVIDPDAYGKWLRVGMILHGAYQGDEEGLGVWINCASSSAKFDEEEHHYKWGTFGKTGGQQLGLGTLFHLANEALYGE